VGQKILSCVARLKERFGAQYTTAVLKGSKTERVRQNGHAGLSTYGILADNTEREIRDWTEQLAAQGYLQKRGEYNVLKLTPKGWRLLRGEETPQLLKPARRSARAAERRRARVDRESWEGVDRELFDRLRILRRELARAKSVPAYVVLSDASLRDMARHRPTTRDEFLTLYGIGERKCEEYGEVFLPFIADYGREKAGDRGGEDVPP
jgi:ATP-dependent DNA helicase RecQ